MTRKLNNIGEDEIVMSVSDAITLIGMVKYALEDLTDEFEDEECCKLMRREIDVCNRFDKIIG
jgi:hypothetical protein